VSDDQLTFSLRLIAADGTYPYEFAAQREDPAVACRMLAPPGHKDVGLATSDSTGGKRMKKALWSLSLATVLAAAVATPVWAGNGAPSGAHYNLNIIGVENPKSSTLTGSDRHTIFVGLGSKKPAAPVTTDIWLVPGEFKVCDGNGFDAAYDCAGQQVGRGMNGAVFQPPCNTAIPTDFGCAEGTASARYEFWGRALGQPGGSALITTCAYDDLGVRICSSENTLDVFSRGHGKQVFQDVTRALTTLQDVCFDLGGVVTCGDVSLFSTALQDYLWQYDNNGLRLAQIRFYLNQ
jgi:hypothetical protein